MTAPLSSRLERERTLAPTGRSFESGDTLIEVLVALVIIGLTVVALLGVLTTSVTSSAEYRTLASADTVLKNVAEALKDEIQVQPGSTSAYVNCATTYQVVSEYPTSVGPGSGVTVFGTDFPAGPVTITLGGLTLLPADFLPAGAPAATASGTLSATFILPSGYAPGNTYTLSVNSVQSAVPLVVTPPASATAPPPAVSGYSAAISSIEWWNNVTTTFDSQASESPSACLVNPGDNSGIQLITLEVTAPNSLSDTLQFVVTNPQFSAPPGPAVTISATPTTVGVGQPFTFTATVSGAGGVTPTGEVGWTFNSTSPGSPACATGGVSGSGNSATATCTIAAAQAGTYQVTANYSGDAHYGFSSGFGTFSVVQLTPTIAVSAPPTTVGQPLTFTATITGAGGITPTGTVTWTSSFNGGPPTTVCAPSTNLPPGAGNSALTTCTVTNSAQWGSYAVTAAYSGDPNYTAVNGAGTATIHFPFNVTSVQLQNGGTTGKIDQGDSIIITFSGQANETSICSSWNNTGPWNDTATVSVSSGTNAAGNKLTLTNSDCNIGSITLGSATDPSYVSGGKATFNNSTVSWNAATFTLTIQLVNGDTGSGNRHIVSTSSPVYTNAPITDPFADPVANLPFSFSAGQQQF